MSIRSERVASLIKEEIGTLLIREYADPTFGFITVTEAKMTADLKIARIYLSIFGSEGTRARTMKMLESEKHHIRGVVGSRLTMKFVPALEFYLDETLDKVDRINTLIKKIHEDEHRETPES